MRTAIMLAALAVTGMTGMLLFFGGHEDIWILLLSKPAGIMLLALACRISQRLNRGKQTTIFQTNKYRK